MTAGVAGSVPTAADLVAADRSTAADGLDDRDPVLSRGDGDRRSSRASRDSGDVRATVVTVSAVDKMLTAKAVQKAIEGADRRLWTTATLNLWTRPDDKANKRGELASDKKVLVTGRSFKGREEVVVGGNARWVTAGYLSPDKPFGLGGECTNGSSVPSGVSPNVALVHEAVCAAFPEITSYGTFRSDGEHAQGIAIDIMVSGDRGWQVAEFVREHYDELGVSYLIYSQQIWSVDRAGDGWRGMEDRGSTTANHYDHVHVTTY